MPNKVKKKRKANKKGMVNITINIPEIYDENIQKLIKMKVISSRSAGIRTAIKEFLYREYDQNLGLLGFFKGVKSKKMISGRKLGEINFNTKIEDLEVKIQGKDNLINYLKTELRKHEKGDYLKS